MKPSSLLLPLCLVMGCASLQKPPADTAHATTADTRPDEDPAAMARIFYAELRRETIHGLPTAAQLQRLSPCLAPGLLRLFAEADAEQKRFIRQHPDEKPPWIEGDLFSSLFEGVERWRLGEVTRTGTRASVKVHLSYRGHGPDTVRWSDTLLLVRTADGWRLDDIRMEGEWAFKNGDTLRGILTAREDGN